MTSLLLTLNGGQGPCLQEFTVQPKSTQTTTAYRGTATPLYTGEAQGVSLDLRLCFFRINSESMFSLSASFSHDLKKHMNCLKSPYDK